MGGFPPPVKVEGGGWRLGFEVERVVNCTGFWGLFEWGGGLG